MNWKEGEQADISKGYGSDSPHHVNLVWRYSPCPPQHFSSVLFICSPAAVCAWRSPNSSLHRKGKHWLLATILEIAFHL